MILFDPSYGTLNMGDLIIAESVIHEMDYLFQDSFLTRYSSHTPLMHSFQRLRKNRISNILDQAKYKFLGGSNMLKTNLLHPIPDWNINIFSSSLYKNSISIGCGIAGNGEKTPNWYTRQLYSKALSKDFIHSTRDEKTKSFLEKQGFKAINTGCPTTWRLTPEFCSAIPKTKASTVVFTLTDYHRDTQQDQALIDILMKSYSTVYFWIQGSHDLEYLRSLKNTEDIKLVSPSLEHFRQVLSLEDIEYIGTRLHAGIFALHNLKRSTIITIDNRTRDMRQNFNLNTIERSQILELESRIHSEVDPDIRINQHVINEWKAQFTS